MANVSSALSSASSGAGLIYVLYCLYSCTRGLTRRGSIDYKVRQTPQLQDHRVTLETKVNELRRK